MDLGLRGKRALVCASSKGLGLAIAETLAAEGSQLFICARSNEELASAAKRIAKQYDVRVEYLAVDLSQPEAVEKLAAAVNEKYSGIDILINNVGGPAPTLAGETTLEQWQIGFQQIFLSATMLSQKFLPAMKAQNFGRIITVTSLSAVEPIERLAVSNAMRAAITGYTKTLSREVASHGVTVNTIMPGIIHTQRIENLRQNLAERQGTTLGDEMRRTAENIPMKRLGRPEEFAAAVAFIASTKASYISGANLPVDGGARNSWA